MTPVIGQQDDLNSVPVVDKKKNKDVVVRIGSKKEKRKSKRT
jgi:hypothetical protein